MLNMNGDTVATATPAAAVFSTLRRDVPALPLWLCPLSLFMIASQKLPIFSRSGPEQRSHYTLSIFSKACRIRCGVAGIAVTFAPRTPIASLIALATAAGAPAAVANAINDAIGVLGAKVTAIPATPQRILQALEKIDKV